MGLQKIMRKLLLHFLIAVALLKDNTKKVLIRYSIFSLLTIFSIFGIFKIIERQQIKTQLKTQIRISQILKDIQDTQKVIEANQVRELAIKKVSKIISKYNHSLDELTLRSFANEVFLMTLKYDNLDINLISATISHESAGTWEPTIVSPAGAMGLMQIMPATGQYLARHEGIEWTNSKDILFNPITNIRLGSRYLSMLITKYSLFLDREKSVEAALAAYNGGERRVAYWISKRRNWRNYTYLYKETRTYIPRVLGLYDKFLSM